MALFQKNHEYEDTAGGAVVAIDSPHASSAVTAELPQHLESQRAALEEEAAKLAALEAERIALLQALDAARAKAQELEGRLAFLQSPRGLATLASDQEIPNCARELLEANRRLGLAEIALEDFNQSSGDLNARRQALVDRQEKLATQIEKWELEEAWFSDVGPALEAALVKLCGWHQKRVVAHRTRGVIMAAGVNFGDPGYGPLTVEGVRRTFAFMRALYGRGDQAGFEKELELARTKNQFPSRPFISWG